MIQVGTILRIIDNTGAKTALCLKVQPGYKKRYANQGDIVTVSIKSLRLKRRDSIKIKKGEIYRALIVRVKKSTKVFSGDSFSNLYYPCGILLSKQNKILGTRVFGSISKSFRFSKFMKLISISSGISF